MGLISLLQITTLVEYSVPVAHQHFPDVELLTVEICWACVKNTAIVLSRHIPYEGKEGE